MLNNESLNVFSKWSAEFNSALMGNNSLCVAIFSTDKELLFANNSMSVLFKIEPHKSLINPNFDKLLSLDYSKTLIFEGHLTIGNYISVNPSIWAQIYRKENQFLIVGGVDFLQLFEQNETMHQLNREISILQRELIKEKHNLEATLTQLNLTNNELNKLNADKDRFISILAHDLRNPFNTLLGFSELLLKNLHRYDIQKIETQLKVINKTSHQTYNLLEQILLWAKSQSGKISIENQKFSFIEVTEKIIYSFDNQAIEKNIVIYCFESEKTILSTDLNIYKAVMRNLISNAIKFTKENGRINIFIEKSKSKNIVTVSDNGIGIEKNLIPKLWDITSNYSTTGTNNEKGTGFGLIICKELIEKLGEQIWVESEIGKGSSFKFTLPLYNEAKID